MQDNLNIAIEAALKAGTEILKVYNTDFDVVVKKDDSPLTQADKNANEVINPYLKKTDIPIISEENKQLPYAERKQWNTCWIVDPLDGTKEFINRNGEFTVNIALVENGTPQLGVIYVPVTKTLYFTAANLKSSKKIVLESEDVVVDDILKNAKDIKPELNPDVINIVASRSDLNVDTDKFKSEVGENQPVDIDSKDSPLKLYEVAEGKAHLYPSYASTM